MNTQQIAQIVAAVTVAMSGMGSAKPMTKSQKYRAAEGSKRKGPAPKKGPFDAQASINKAVAAKGFKTPGVANENVLTYGKWEAKGFKVKTGEKALKIGTLRLFHEEQVEAVVAPSAA